MRKLILVCFIVLLNKLVAQTTQDSIKQTINNMFFAMKNIDTNTVKSCFSKNAFLETIVNKIDDSTFIKRDSVHNFINQIKKLNPNDADEQVVFETIKMDDNLAMVWTPYQFFYKQKFSHCGVNNFVLVRQNNKWLIQYIIDTRRKNCN